MITTYRCQLHIESCIGWKFERKKFETSMTTSISIEAVWKKTECRKKKEIIKESRRRHLVVTLLVSNANFWPIQLSWCSFAITWGSSERWRGYSWTRSCCTPPERERVLSCAVKLVELLDWIWWFWWKLGGGGDNIEV